MVDAGDTPRSSARGASSLLPRFIRPRTLRTLPLEIEGTTAGSAALTPADIGACSDDGNLKSPRLRCGVFALPSLCLVPCCTAPEVEVCEEAVVTAEVAETFLLVGAESYAGGENTAGFATPLSLSEDEML